MQIFITAATALYLS